MSNTKRASSTTPVKIVSRWDSEVVLFCADIDREVPMHKRIMEAVKLALKSRANLNGADLRGADLSHADLSCANLHGANLCGADLSCANLNGADLRGADLRGADMSRASMGGADLRGASLHGADLNGADLRGADLNGANLRQADMSRADLCGANLRGASLHSASLPHASLRYADLRGADLSFLTNLNGADLSHARMIGAVYKGTKIGDGGLLKRASRSDGYDFLLFDCEDGQCRIAAGCRWFTLEEAWRHWSGTRDETALGEETFDILVMFEHHAARRAGKVMEF